MPVPALPPAARKAQSYNGLTIPFSAGAEARLLPRAYNLHHVCKPDGRTTNRRPKKAELGPAHCLQAVVLGWVAGLHQSAGAPMATKLQVHTIVSMPFEENTYVVWKSGASDALVIDPGLEPDLILDFLRERELTAAAILNTHGHADHIGGNAALKQAFSPAPLIIGAGESHLLSDAEANLSAPFGLPITSPPADRLVREGDTVEAAGIRLEVLEVPGHSPGHVVYLYRDQPMVLFGGDVLFRGSIGRYDFPNSNGPLLLTGIKEKLLTLPPDTVVYPGHGPTTTIGHEKRTNPYVGG
jgi:glyoxylase-like metal-dependent hydrolase (beta-lactamase superfamily II)